MQKIIYPSTGLSKCRKLSTGKLVTRRTVFMIFFSLSTRILRHETTWNIPQALPSKSFPVHPSKVIAPPTLPCLACPYHRQVNTTKFQSQYFTHHTPIPAALRYKALVCGRSITTIGGSNPVVDIIFVSYFIVCCVGSGLCEEPITRSEESYRLCVI